MALSQHLINRKRGAGREIERASLVVEVRDLYFAIRTEPRVNLVGRARAFVAEDEPVTFLELRIPKTACRLGGEKPETLVAAG